MNVSLEKKDALNGTISVNISGADYMPEMDKKIKDYRKKANIPGFRPGQAPLGMIERMYGNSLILEEINAAASKGLYDYIKENNINMLGEPVINNETLIEKIDKGADYTFKFDIGVAPVFELSISKDDTFTRLVVQADEKMIDDEITRMRKRFGKLEDVAKAESDNDMIYCTVTELNEDLSIFEGGVHAEKVPFLISTIKNEEIKNALKGIAIAEESTVNIFNLFDSNEAEISHALGVQKAGIADLNPNFKLQVSEIKRNTEAEINQELFDSVYGKDKITSIEDFRSNVKTELESFYVGQADHLLEHEMSDTIVAKHNIQLPDAFLKRWLLDRYADKFNAENIDEGYNPEANYLRNHLLEEKILALHNIKVEDEDIRQAAVNYTKQMFGGYSANGLSEELINQLIEPSLQKEDYRSRMINAAIKIKVNAAIRSSVTVNDKEISAEDFMKIVQEHNHAHHAH